MPFVNELTRFNGGGDDNTGKKYALEGVGYILIGSTYQLSQPLRGTIISGGVSVDPRFDLVDDSTPTSNPSSEP